MKKIYMFALFAMAALMAKAQDPTVVMTVQVDGNSRTLEFSASEAGKKLQIDWGDGVLVETDAIPDYDETWDYLKATGTPVGEGVIKVYGEINYLDCSSRVDGAQVTALDVTKAPDLKELIANTNSLTTLDLSKNPNLTKLVCNGNPITELDLSANTALTSATLSDMALTSIDLSKNTALKTLYLNNNDLKSVDLSANTSLGTLYALNCGLTSIDLSANTALATVSLNNNALTSLDVTALTGLKSLFCLNNNLTELKTGAIATTVNCSGNNLALSALPTPGARTYTYVPQKPMQIAETVAVNAVAKGKVDLSSETNLQGVAAEPQATTYTWKTKKGDDVVALVAGEDYTEAEGVFTFLKAQAEPVYCEMTTAAFPNFTGVNVFRTTETMVKELPNVVMTVQVDGNSRTLEFSASEAGKKLQIDWGNGVLVDAGEMPVYDGYGDNLEVTGTPVGEGIIKIYGELAYLDCFSRVDGAQVTALDVTNAPDLEELYVYTNSLTSLDLSKNVKLKKLDSHGNPITELDLSANTALTRVTLNDMALTSIDLSNNAGITTLYLSDNDLQSVNLSGATSLSSLYALNCGLTSIDLSANTALTYVSLNNNALTSLDVTALTNLKSLFCLNNNLTELKTGAIATTVNCSGNSLTLSALPTPGAKNYTYVPQNPMQIAETVEVGVKVDLSSETNLQGVAAEPQATTYTWKTKNGDEVVALVAGEDYTEAEGVFTFLKAQAEPVYCEMTTAAFPSFTGDKAFTTTEITVLEMPDPTVVMTVQVDGNSRALEFSASEAGKTLRIDWGDGVLVETDAIPDYDATWQYLEATGTPVGEGVIKVYGEINYLDCSSRVDGAQITALDVTNAPDLEELYVYTNSLTSLDLNKNVKLQKLDCHGNPITELDLSANTALTRVTLNDMALTSIDLSNNAGITTLYLSNNNLQSVDLSGATSLSSLYALNCGLTSIDLSANTALTYVSLNNNALTSLDVTALTNLKSLFCLNNNLTELKTGAIATTVNCSGNNLTLSALPTPGAKNYTYVPQNPMQIAETVEVGVTVDLSSETNLQGVAAEPQATTYTWKTKKGDDVVALVAGEDYTEAEGVFTFLKAQAEPVYCEMTTAAFPNFTGDKAFRTTEIRVEGTSGIADAAAATVKVQGADGRVKVTGLTVGDKVAVYSVAGVKVADVRAAGAVAELPLPVGIYVVTVNGKAVKVAVK